MLRALHQAPATLKEHWRGSAAAVKAVTSEGVQRPAQSSEFVGLTPVHIREDAAVMLATSLKGVVRWLAFLDVQACLSHH
jgi:hypothetical protein